MIGGDQIIFGLTRYRYLVSWKLWAALDGSLFGYVLPVITLRLIMKCCGCLLRWKA